jgi:GMP synthase (glutamine-hydrolysing)
VTQDIHRDRLLILDFGSQYTQLIARRIREVGVYCEIMPWDTDASDISAFVPSGIILSGGPESVTETDSPRAPDIVFALDVPLLGICYGMQTMAAQLGGVVEGSDTSEFGYAQIRRTSPGGLFADFSDETDSSGRQLLDVWMSHGDKVSQLPPDFERIAETDSCPIAGMAHIDKPWFGIQFHPEVTHTAQGENIFTYFVQQICACETLWTPCQYRGGCDPACTGAGG